MFPSEKPGDPEKLFEMWWNQRLARLNAEERNAEWWFVKVAAFVLEMAAATVRRNITEGKYGYTRIGGKLMVHVPSLKLYLKQNIRKYS